MMPQINVLPSAISEIFVQATHSGHLTLADRYGLMAAILTDSISEEERPSIDRLLRSASRGQIKIVSDLSTIH